MWCRPRSPRDDTRRSPADARHEGARREDGSPVGGWAVATTEISRVDPTGRRLVRRGLLRAAVSAVVTTVYYVLPLVERADARVVLELTFAIVMLGALVAWHLRAIVRASYPGIRAIQALATATSLFLLLFSATYFILSAQDPSSFGEPLTRSDALYFTLTICSTVGFATSPPTPESHASSPPVRCCWTWRFWVWASRWCSRPSSGGARRKAEREGTRSFRRKRGQRSRRRDPGSRHPTDGTSLHTGPMPTFHGPEARGAARRRSPGGERVVPGRTAHVDPGRRRRVVRAGAIPATGQPLTGDRSVPGRGRPRGLHRPLSRAALLAREVMAGPRAAGLPSEQQGNGGGSSFGAPCQAVAGA